MNEPLFEDMIWYSVQFLGDLSYFLLTTPVFWFVVLGCVFFAIKIFKKLVA